MKRMATDKIDGAHNPMILSKLHLVMNTKPLDSETWTDKSPELVLDPLSFETGDKFENSDFLEFLKFFERFFDGVFYLNQAAPSDHS